MEILGEEFRWIHLESIADIDRRQWDACAGGHPLLRHGFFRALESSGSVGRGTFWAPGYFVLLDGDGVMAAGAPTFLKWGGLREFGPEITWLQAGVAAGCFDWPKFQLCSPLYPQTAPKLLIHPSRRSTAFRSELLRVLVGLGLAQFSAVDIMHIGADDARACSAMGALISSEFTSVWANPGVTRFEDYVAGLPSRKRRMLRRERAAAHRLGLTFAVHSGAEIPTRLIDDFFDGFTATCGRHGGAPWFPRALLDQLIERMPDAVRVFTAHDGIRYVAGVFCLRSTDTLYLEHWSAPHDVPGLCFEMMCHRAIEYAIDEGLQRVDAGVPMPYKTIRGYRDEPVFNAHWFGDERLASLARRVLASEAQSAFNIGEQIDRILDPDRQAHQVVGNLQL